MNTVLPCSIVRNFHITAREKNAAVEVLPGLHRTAYAANCIRKDTGRQSTHVFDSLDTAVGMALTFIMAGHHNVAVDRADYYPHGNRLTPIMRHDWTEYTDPSADI